MESQGIPDFRLPFEAYSAQKKFMQDAYRCMEESRFGLFESPTGSGKTIAMLCSALTWLNNNRLKDAVSRLQPGVTTDTTVPLWVQRNMEAQQSAIAEKLIETELQQLLDARERLKNIVTLTEDGVRIRPGSKRRRDFAPESEGHTCADSKTTRDKIQIIISSRTFTQLNQYVKEFRRLGALSDNLKIGIATGRHQSCINEAVRSRCKTNEEFNEECRRIQCDFRDDVNPLAEASICFPMDLEDLRAAGTSLCSCPYYASSKSISQCDVILAPYISVFNSSIRKSMDLKIDGNVLIVDEAHNLVDAISASHSSVISTSALAALSRQCVSFVEKYQGKINEDMKAGIASIESVSRLLLKCKHLFDNSTCQDKSMVLSIPGFLVKLGLESARLDEILTFLVSNEFCGRLSSFAKHLSHKHSGKSTSVVQPRFDLYTTVVYTFRHFIATLLSSTDHERVIITSLADDIEIELFNVSADEQFRSLTKGARSVLLMSGTLTPLEEFMGLSPYTVEPIVHQSPPVFATQRFYVSVLSGVEQGIPLVYDSTSRERHREISTLCHLVGQLSTVVPNGIVCFVSSYKFLDYFQSVFEQSTIRVNVLKNKKVFFESSDKGKDIFTNYSKEALGRGAILFAVYGGSLSEGVDFHDGLARLVLLVGLPYPPETVKLQLRRNYYNTRALQSDVNQHQRNLYVKLANHMRTFICFKTVNQSIGRAMRHKNDFAAILLLDARYNEADNMQLLPSYVTRSLQNSALIKRTADPVDTLVQGLKQFYLSCGVNY